LGLVVGVAKAYELGLLYLFVEYDGIAHKIMDFIFKNYKL
jgi:hypothetical protein